MSERFEARDLVVRYGKVQVLHGVSIAVEPGEVVAVIGRNGAGKTTLLRTIFGFVRPAAGSIRFEGVDLTAHRAHAMAGLGIAYVPEERGVFTELSVIENLRLGAMRARAEEAARLEQVFELFPLLEERAGALAGTLSGGQQQMLSIGRALMTGPRLMLLDEPSLGLAPKVLDSLFAILAKLAERGLSILLVEQNVKRSLAIADRGYLLNLGRVAMEGPAAEMLQDESLQSVYLGRAEAPA